MSRQTLSTSVAVEDVVDVDTLGVMLDRRQVENAQTREEIEVLLNEADEYRQLLTQRSRKDSSRAFLHTDVSIKNDDLEFRLAAAERRVHTIDKEIEIVEGKTNKQVHQINALKLSLQAQAEEIQRLHASNTELRDRFVGHQVNLKNVTVESGSAAHDLHLRLKDVLHQIKMHQQAIDRVRRTHASIAAEADGEMRLHREHADELRQRIAATDEKISETDRKIDEVSGDTVHIEKSLSDVLAYEEQLRRQIEAKDKHVALLHTSVNKGRQATSALNNQNDTLQQIKRELEADYHTASHKVSLANGRLRVLQDALTDLELRRASVQMTLPRPSLLTLEDVASLSTDTAGELGDSALDTDGEGFGDTGQDKRIQSMSTDGARDNMDLDLASEREQLEIACNTKRDALRQRVVEEQLKLRDLDRKCLELEDTTRTKYVSRQRSCFVRGGCGC